MKIAVDAMGGDDAPAAVVEGAIQACREHDYEILLVGDQYRIQAELNRHRTDGLPLSVAPASQVIDMHDQPAQACKEKPDSSIMVGTRMVRDKRADAFYSAGNSGAIMAASIMNLGRARGVIRPGIVALMPTLKGPCLIMDVGANVDCQPKHLYQFALMGNIYMKYVLNKDHPRVGILSIGEEPGKGNELSLETYEMLRNSPLRFVGNIEGRDIPEGKVDVVVCDGFVGNVVLKFAEGLARAMMQMIKERIKKSPIRVIASYLLLRGVFKDIARKVDYDEVGGAPLLGIDGAVIVGHGLSNAKAIKNGIRVAAEYAEHKISLLIEQEVTRGGGRTPGASPSPKLSGGGGHHPQRVGKNSEED